MDTQPTIKEIARLAAKQRRVGDGARCACGETDPRCLTRNGDIIRCYECAQIDAGRSPIEQHHVAGRRNSAQTVPIPANEHRILSDWQLDWHPATLRNPDGSPVLSAASAVEGWLNVLRLIIERTVGWIPDFLVRVDAWLREHLGDRYWTLPNFPQVRR
jgi:hypothetical protein